MASGSSTTGFRTSKWPTTCASSASRRRPAYWASWRTRSGPGASSAAPKPKTASVHVSNILAKLGVHTRVEADALYRQSESRLLAEFDGRCRPAVPVAVAVAVPVAVAVADRGGCGRLDD